MDTRPGSLRFVRRLAALALFFSFTLAPTVRAQTVVHVPAAREASPVASPPDADSVSTWASQAKAGFRSNPGDSAGGENYRPYEKVGLIGRRLLRSLGRGSLLQAHAIKPVLDSLGFVTEVATDPASPNFALLMVRNPARHTAEAVGFLYWYKGDDLRIQGALFKGGYHPRIRVWRTGKPEYPFEWGILDETHAGMLGLTMLRLSPGGTVWGIQQDEERFPLLGEPGEGAWLDLNQDGSPELVSWTRAATDSLFTECPGCPKLLTERTFVEGGQGFELQDERLLPTPYATLVYFVRLLIDGRLAEAEKLVRDPAKVREAVALGWNQRHGPQALVRGARRERRDLAAPAGAALRGPERREALRRDLRDARGPLDHRQLVRAPGDQPALPIRDHAARHAGEAARLPPEDEVTMPGLRPFVPVPSPATGASARRRAPALLALVFVAALGATLSGCSRQPRFVPAPADSSLAVAGDSLAEQVRILNKRWSAAGGGEEASRLTAQVLLQDLSARLTAKPRISWEERARVLLDSLDVGAEFVSARCALGVNFFSRSNPIAGSWPWIFWCDGTAVRAQAVEGVGMGLVGLAARGLSGEVADRGDPPGIAALFARRAGGGQQPLLLTWRVAKTRLDLAQTLGPDSLGGVGTGAFETPGDTAAVLRTRTWRPTPRFDECATCPHVYRERRFRWGLEGFERVEDAVVPTPYVTFVQLDPGAHHG